MVLFWLGLRATFLLDALSQDSFLFLCGVPAKHESLPVSDCKHVLELPQHLYHLLDFILFFLLILGVFSLGRLRLRCDDSLVVAVKHISEDAHRWCNYKHISATAPH